MPSLLTVFIVTLELERADGSRTHDRKWVAAQTAAQARERALESAARRWPGYRPVGVVSVRVDHSRRARRFLRETGEPAPELRVPRARSDAAERPEADEADAEPSGGRRAWRLLDEAARALRLRLREDAKAADARSSSLPRGPRGGSTPS